MPLVQQPVALSVIAAPAGRDDVVPFVTAAARTRHDVIACQLAVEVFVPAVQTDVAVAAEQRLIRQRRNVPHRRYDAAFARNDAVNFHVRLRTVEAGMSAADLKIGFAERPDDEFARVQTNGVLPGQPFDRLTRNVEPQDARRTLEVCQHHQPEMFLSNVPD